MAKSDLDGLIQEAQDWLQVVSNIQRCAEEESWDELAEWHRKREENVRRYQELAASFDVNQWPAASLQPLEAALRAIQQIEEALILRFQDYQQNLGESLKSVQMEGTLRHRYGLDDT